MTRIIAGSARGRRLAVPPAGTRPTTDRVREALFSALEHRLGSFDSLVVLDLFAGSGALGLEAASRGAAGVLLVDDDQRAVSVLNRNAAAVGSDGVRVVRRDAWHLGSRERAVPDMPPAEVVLLDPPYEDSAERLANLLARLAQDGWLASDALAAVERPVRGGGFPWPTGWENLGDRRYGETQISLGRWVESPLTARAERSPT